MVKMTGIKRGEIELDNGCTKLTIEITDGYKKIPTKAKVIIMDEEYGLPTPLGAELSANILYAFQNLEAQMADLKEMIAQLVGKEVEE